MKLVRSCIVAVMTMSLGMILVDAGMNAQARHNIEINCATEVSVENWQIKAHITTSGVVSENTIEKVCEIIQTKVPTEAWNFLCNSGGNLIIVEGNDIKEYILCHYNCEEARKIEEDIKGYCPYFRNGDGILEKVDIVIAADCLDSLEHEFYHALDYSHDYSSTKEFRKIYESIDGSEIFSLNGEREYYMGDIEEFFAETAKRYANGELNGVDAELEKYLSEVLS